MGGHCQREEAAAEIMPIKEWAPQKHNEDVVKVDYVAELTNREGTSSSTMPGKKNRLLHAGSTDSACIQEDTMTSKGSRTVTSVSSATHPGLVEEWPGLGRLMPENLDFFELTHGRKPRRIQSVEHRGISIHQLQAVLAFVKRRCDEQGLIRGWYDPRSGKQLLYTTLNIYHVIHWIFKPLTRSRNCTFVEALAGDDEPPRPEWFAGHWSGEPFVDFVRRVRKFATTKKLPKSTTFWVCPASTRLYECSGLTVDTQGGNHGLLGVSELTTLKVHLTGCLASRSAVDELGCFIFSLKALTVLVLDFSGCHGMTNTGKLWESLPALQNLHTLRLNLSGSTTIENMQELGQGLSKLHQTLSTLSIDVSKIPFLENVEDFTVGLKPLQALVDLTLDFSNCPMIASVGELGKDLAASRHLRRFHLSLSGCHKLESIEKLGHSFAAHQELKVLEINMTGCSKLVTVAELGFSLAIMKGLTTLDLNFFGCSRLLEVDELGRGLTGLKSIENLKLGFFGCTGLQSNAGLREGLSTLRQLRPNAVFELHVPGAATFKRTYTLSLANRSKTVDWTTADS
mmetsp:Transcript_20747/g.45609  ORF Transcript_20747/g.45609 Transcript_20747/m.45609 type:complete len:569 (-) Transcript_20747:173-1879(-)